MPTTVDVCFDLDQKTTAKFTRVYLPGTTSPDDDIANTAKLELTRFRGHLMVRFGGVLYGRQECSICAGV
jgi:hypothetical protein